MATMNVRQQARLKRKKRIRKKIFGTSDQPRLSVFRSTKHIFAQLIDDTTGSTIACASSLEEVAKRPADQKGKAGQASLVGKLIGERAKEKGIEKVVFDRNGFLYHGRVKAVSEGAREAGLKL